jgi:hypothetical protein
MPSIRCEGISFHESGEYRVMLIRGFDQDACPTPERMQAARALPVVSSWMALSNGRIKISRTDVPTHFEEWEMHVVARPFEHSAVAFAPGDLVAYLRRQPGAEIDAALVFRHLRPLK